MAQEDVDTIRALLGEIGREQYINEEEVNIVGSNNKVYLQFQDVEDVVGVWLSSDIEKTGTNYWTGGSLDSRKGIVTLGTSLAPNTEVVVVYIRKNGLSDELIEEVYEYSKMELNNMMFYEYNFDDPQDDLDRFAKKVAHRLSVFHCMLILNSGNIIQSGYNFRLVDFEIQTKLWGEGMISQTLFETEKAKLDQMLITLAQKTGEVKSLRLNGMENGYSFYRKKVRRAAFDRGAQYIEW